MPLTVYDEDLFTKDSAEVLVIAVDYDAEALAAGAELTSAGFFSITPAGLTVDDETLMAGNRMVEFSLADGVTGTTYRMEHRVVTNEVPPQTLVAVSLVRIT
jgi:hypothetical protein